MTASLLAFHMKAQPTPIGFTTLRFTDRERGDRRIGVRIYYPSAKPGKDAPVSELSGEKFPVICFGHGYQLPAEIYENICRVLVPEGFIIAFPLTERGIFPSHAALGYDIAFVVQQLKKVGESGNSMFSGKISDKCCYMGHSMGGGAALLAAASGFSPDAIALLAPYETSPSAITAAGKVTCPALIVAGGNDCITPPGKNQEPVYYSLKSKDKTYIILIGGSHCQMADKSRLCYFAEATCRPKPTISPEDQHALINKYLIPWLKSTLKGEVKERLSLDESLKNDQSVSFQVTRDK